VADRLEQHGDRNRGGHRQDRAAAVSHQRPDAHHNAGVRPRDRSGEQPVHQSAVDDDVDRVQPVLEDRHRDGSRKPDHNENGHHDVRAGDQPREGGMARGGGEQGRELGGERRHASKREPLDLLA
jgi:hypothetical protein